MILEANANLISSVPKNARQVDSEGRWLFRIQMNKGVYLVAEQKGNDFVIGIDGSDLRVRWSEPVSAICEFLNDYDPSLPIVDKCINQLKYAVADYATKKNLANVRMMLESQSGSTVMWQLMKAVEAIHTQVECLSESL